MHQSLKSDLHIVVETIIEIWEKYFPETNEHNNILQLLNSVCDKYLPIQQAMWNGSYNCIQVLISKYPEIDLNCVNTKGETLDEILEGGMRWNIQQTPQNRGFIIERYSESKKVLDTMRIMLTAKASPEAETSTDEIPIEIVLEIRSIADDLDEIAIKILSNENPKLYYRAAESILSPEKFAELHDSLINEGFEI